MCLPEGELKVVSPFDVDEKILSSNQSIYRHDFSRSDGFNAFKYEFIKNAMLLLDKNGMDSQYRKIIESDLDQHSQFVQIEGLADIYVFHWASGEPKFLEVREGMLLEKDAFWLEFYPFLEVSKWQSFGLDKRKASHVNIRKELFETECLKDEYMVCELRTVLSHNNHFGHYILDDLPGQWLRSFIGSSISQIRPLQYGWKRGVHEVASYFETLRQGSHQDCLNPDNQYANQIILNVGLSTTWISDIVLSSFILKSALRRLRSNQKQKLSRADAVGKRVLLIRSGQYESRIENFLEVRMMLEREFGVVVAEASVQSVEGLISLLDGAELVIAETGTTTLVANVFSPPNCKVVALMPERMFSRPSMDMLKSGFPYHLTSPERTLFCLGESTRESVIQSSDVATYNIEEMRSLINNILNRG